jgi:histidinol phosphatase-like enzyme
MNEEETRVCNTFIHRANELAQEHGVDNFTIVEGMMGALAAYVHYTVTTNQKGMWTPYDHEESVKQFDAVMVKTINERVKEPTTLQ